MYHYDNKIAQKKLLESINAPLVPTHIFFSKEKAVKWSNSIKYPIVFKLSTGAGSTNVKLVHSQSETIKLINKSFDKGHSPLDRNSLFKDRIWHFKRDKNLKSIFGLFKGLVRLFVPTKFERLSGREKGYIYFQDFIPNNKYDIRIIIIGKKELLYKALIKRNKIEPRPLTTNCCVLNKLLLRRFALHRNIRKDDFRASGSGSIEYNKELFDPRCIEISFEISKKLNFSSMAYDYVFDDLNNPLLVEISYCFNKDVYYPCPGYWDEDLNWNKGTFKSQDFIITDIIDKL